ncbi:MAG: hypothetical protein ACI9OS_001725 [Ulvibacter sp.]|jgi:hypothetical protein
MIRKLNYLLYFFSLTLFAQQQEATSSFSNITLTPEIMGGFTAEPNGDFPDHGFQKQLMFSLGWDNRTNRQEWAQRLKGPRTGISVGYANFGNDENLGYALTLMPFIEINAFGRKKLKVVIGMGASYFNKIFDPITNPNNQAVTTRLNWSFRLFMHYQIISSERMDWRLGAGYFHHSNGHTRLANQGYNSFLISLSADIKNNSKKSSPVTRPDFKRSSYNYFTLRSGFGINTMTKSINEQKGVYTISAETGKVFNNIYKIGVGAYYRFYQTYYDYIVNNETLVQDGREFDYLKKDPWSNATNFGLSIKGEILLNHFGIDLQFGFSFHKPAYPIDWRLNQGWYLVPRYFPEDSRVVLGDLNKTSYKIKRILSARLALKYYLIGTKIAPKNNLFVSVNLNSNYGQADFTEIGIGYVHSFNFKSKE